MEICALNVLGVVLAPGDEADVVFTSIPGQTFSGVVSRVVSFSGQSQLSPSGTIAVYTRFGKPVHVISKVALRMNAWLGYLTSP